MTTETDLEQWLGRTETATENIDVNHIGRMAATLGTSALDVGDALPMLWHWGLFNAAMPYERLGIDGHPVTGDFLPPAGNRPRMWAGGRVEFIHPLLVGSSATRKSTVQSITEKEGRSGKLMFVTVQHEYAQDFVVCLREEQNIVYRQPGPPRIQPNQPAPEAEWSQDIEPSPVMLFRYSAVTFNGHRIHYDHNYVTQEEGYPGLVVHGPLIATLMCREFARTHHDKVPVSLTYRGLSPLIAPAPFTVAGRLVDDASALNPSSEEGEAGSGASDGATGIAELWAEHNGMLAHQGRLRYK